jgi:dolichol-phosphate mannosyltransferase
MNFRSRLHHIPLIRRILGERFIKFGTVGFSGTVINLTALYLNQEYLFRWVESPETRLPLSLAGAIFVATLNNFLWNRGWTWKDRKEGTRHGLFLQMGQYFLASGFAICIQYLSTLTLSQAMHYVLANLLSIGLAALFNYLVNDLWTFAVRRQSPNRGIGKMTSLVCGAKIGTVEGLNEDRHRHTYL